jgi:Ala-tRNA(Pro) deacylase
MESGPVENAIRLLLQQHNVTFREVRHAATRTSAESAAARGEELRIGGKALVVKVGGAFKLFVLSAARRFDTAAIRRHFAARDIRFATPDELLELTGLVPGSVPPFGRPVLPLELFVDESIPANPRIAFNAGSLTLSFVLEIADYLRVAQPQVLEFSKPDADVA